MSSILGSQRLEAGFLPTFCWLAAQWPLPIQITRDRVPFFQFPFSKKLQRRASNCALSAYRYFCY
jgi:hypothetical protein